MKERGSWTITNLCDEDIPFEIMLEGGDQVKDVFRANEVVAGITNYKVIDYFRDHFSVYILVEWVPELKQRPDWMKEGF